MAILVTGGAGFIGSNFILQWLAHRDEPIINLDHLTYAGNLRNLASVENSPKYMFVKGDIGDTSLIQELLGQHRPRAILNFAAESHVDRSISSPESFIQTNVLGTLRLLDATLHHWRTLSSVEQSLFRFLHVSTDEVYGSLRPEDPAFNEQTPYAPNSPYSASKASSDHIVRAYHHTYGLPALTTHCSNNYGPRQFPEKLVPLMIHNALQGLSLPVYGDGHNVRDWLYVEDHCSAITDVLEQGTPGDVYTIGGLNEKTNLEVVYTICDILQELKARPEGGSYRSQIQFIKDRPGHDRRYATDPSKIQKVFGWQPKETFETGLRKTVQWYLDNQDWVASVIKGDYRQWIAQQYA